MADPVSLGITALVAVGSSVAASAIGGRSQPKVLPRPTATPRASAASDAIMRRRGSAVNMRTGQGGAESSQGTGKKQFLGN